MTEQEYKKYVDATYPDVASNFGVGTMVVPLTKRLLIIIEAGLEKLKEDVEREG